jgi:RNA polymerase sigma-70 factor (ECF subfamily)
MAPGVLIRSPATVGVTAEALPSSVIMAVRTVLVAAMALDLPNPAGLEERRLIAASRRGDADAFTQLVRRHERRVFRLASRFFSARDEVEDAAQDTFLRVWEKLGTYRQRAPFEHWLTRVCLNCCYARLRKRSSDPLSPAHVSLDRAPLEMAALESRGADPDARLEAAELLARLDPRDRFVLTLLHGEGRSTEEIADLLGWSRSNVKVRAHRARRKLRRLIEEEAEP